ncbi:MAG: DUF2313 domain-containing protein [Deltaproteobacteria bacterium]|nr:DUF2313 domain-containing protein [Deltaproteobacteria bacterium]
MLHKDVLQLLFPTELGGVFDADIELEGSLLDEALTSSEQLLAEIFPEQANELLTDWERVCGLTPGASDTLQLRRQKVVAKLREQGSLCRNYYIELAAYLGYTITIEELASGAEGYGDEGIFVWRVTVANNTPIYYFRAGDSSAGDYLLWWPVQTAIEGLFEDLKPAHTQIIFAYS